MGWDGMGLFSTQRAYKFGFCRTASLTRGDWGCCSQANEWKRKERARVEGVCNGGSIVMGAH